MDQQIRILPHLELSDVLNPYKLNRIYKDFSQDYYWSEDFSPEFYAAQAKAGFMAVTEMHKKHEILLPELQKSYAVLKFENLHISKKVKKLISKDQHTLHVGLILDNAYDGIRAHHKHSWLTPRYLEILKKINDQNIGISVVSVLLKHKGTITAGEIGYIIGSTYTSLTGFSSQEPQYRDNGTLQLVLLAQWLERRGFEFWNLGQPYMPYKFALGAKIYHRDKYLKIWHDAIQKILPN